MGYVKNDGGAGIFIKNGQKHISFGSSKISPATFVEIVNEGGGEALLASLTDIQYNQVSMVLSDKICTLQYDGDDYGSLCIGTIDDNGISFGLKIQVYSPYGSDCGFYVMAGGTKILYWVISDSGYSDFDLFDISGKTLTLLTTESLDAIDFVGPDYFGCFKISDTQIISWSTGYSAGYSTNLYVLTVSNTALTKSNVFQLWNKGDEAYKCVYLKGCIISPGKVALLSYEFGGSPYENVRTHLLSISGDSLALINSQTIFANASRVFLSDMIQAINGKAAIIAREQAYANNMLLGVVTLSGNNLTYVEIDTGEVYNGMLPSITPNHYGYELAANYPDIYFFCGYDGFKILTFDVSGSVPSFVSKKTSPIDGRVLTYTYGNAQFGDKGPIIAIAKARGTTGIDTNYLTSGIIRNVGRVEAKEAETKIDGVSLTTLSPDKAGKIWILKGV